MFLQGTCMKVLTEQELSALAGAGELLPSRRDFGHALPTRLAALACEHQGACQAR